ncbi:MAG: hypothetical protein K5657_06710 [Desulfovibrio sp.]|nr:hypothetical protein [Desulfovibrio sp.]
MPAGVRQSGEYRTCSPRGAPEKWPDDVITGNAAAGELERCLDCPLLLEKPAESRVKERRKAKTQTCNVRERLFMLLQERQYIRCFAKKDDRECF